MDIVLDTNILIADIWQDSQNFRFLMDYIKKTNSFVLIPSVVDVEIKSFFTRKVKDSIQEIETAIKRAERFGIREIPPLDTDNIVKATHQSWDVVYETLFKKTHGRVIPLAESIVEEAFRRAAYRLAPCKENGEGIRDVFIWLQILEYCKAKKGGEPVAFISLNTHDFANQDKLTLRPELENDLQEQGVNILYYPSLEYFLKKYAKPISHISNDWLINHVDFSLVEKKIQNYFNTRWQAKWQRDKFKISKSEYREYYQIDDDIKDINVYDVYLENFIIWQFDESHIEVSLDFHAHLEGMTEGELVYPHYSVGFDKAEFRSRQVLACEAELLFHLAAVIAGDAIEIGDIEDVNRY